MFYAEMRLRRGIEEDYTVGQIKLTENKRYNISRTTVIRASKVLGWTFYNSRYCNMLQIGACMQYVNMIRRVDFS